MPLGGIEGGCWALVPAKPFAMAKSRLAEALSGEARRTLARELLAHTLGVLRVTAGLSGVAVISRDPEVEAVAREHGALSLPETSERLDGIIDGGLDALSARGARSGLVVVADLPSLAPEDVAQMIELGERHPVVIAPDERDEGTNALLVSPPDRMRTCFGRRGSFRAHSERAASMSLEVAIFRAPSLGFDLDTVEDLLRLPADGHPRGASISIGLVRTPG
jgi:2-phospho-L-lactate guanylyltransferase